MPAFAVLTIPRIMLARDFLLPLVFVLVLLWLPPLWAAYAIVFGGQAHFFMAYLYQYRAGKMQRASYLVRALILLLLAYWFFTQSPGATGLLFLAASNLFALHFAYDEFTLHKNHFDIGALLTLMGFFALHASILEATNTALDIPYFSVTAQVLGALILAARVLIVRHPLSDAERYLWFVAAIILAAALLVPGLFDPYSVTAIVASLHFYNWMIGYGIRVHRKSIERRYWTETVTTAGLSLALLLLYLQFPQSALALVFSFPAYNAWAIGHIVLSYEPGRG